MTVTRVHEDPRVTRPYTDDAMARDRRARARGRRASCGAADVRLTHGGEPTFVSIDDMDGAEWNYHRAVAAQAGARRERSHGG